MGIKHARNLYSYILPPCAFGEIGQGLVYSLCMSIEFYKYIS